MGLFDIFVAEEMCPSCKVKSVMEFQTKALLNCLVRWEKGEIVETNELMIKDGIVRGCLASCPNCGISLKGDILIQSQKLLGVQNLRVS